jgi:hypothetical protein
MVHFQKCAKISTTLGFDVRPITLVYVQRQSVAPTSSEEDTTCKNLAMLLYHCVVEALPLLRNVFKEVPKSVDHFA